MGTRLLRGSALLAILFSTSLVSDLHAQYFGRQKVHYDKFDWRVLRTDRFRIHYYPAEEAITRDAARMAERWYARYSPVFQHEFEDKPLIFYADAPDFQQTNVIGGLIGQGTGGVTEALRTRLVMPFTGVYADNDHVLGHELVHVFQYDLGERGPQAPGLAGMARVPLWLVEGMAEYLSLGREDPHTAMWMRDATLRGELPTIAELSRDDRYFPYRYGQAVLAYVAGRWGDRAVVELYVAATRNGVESALQEVLGVTSAELSEQWMTAVRSAYLPAIEGRQRARDAGTPIIVDDEIGAMNLAPAVSPDGRYVAYFGRRSVFTVDLLLADARTGQLVRRLSSPTTDAHYDALSFISSSGTWSSDGKRFAFIVFAGGDNRIAILDVDRADVERHIEVEGIGAIQHLAWSPDGTRIAFSGMQSGFSDLYTIDVASGVLTRVTNDPYADLQPAWSPDGRTLVFVTDRDTGTDMQTLRYGKVALAFLDVASGAITPLCVFPDARHVDPHYAPDGSQVFFISDPDGFSDIYRFDLSSGNVFRMTSLATGVSGITEMSPAMSVAVADGRLFYSAFENTGYNIYALDAPHTAGVLVKAEPAARGIAGVLPPFEARGAGLVHDYLSDPLTGLPDPLDAISQDYRTRLSLDYVGPLSIGMGVGAFGTNIAGSGSVWFGDMLGDRFLGIALNASGTVKDIGGYVAWQNLARRLNWGAAVSHIPYLSVFTDVAPAVVDGTPVWEVDQYFERTYVQQAQLFTQYPLSTTRRFELGGGYTRFAFDREVDRYLVDDIGRIIDSETVDASAPASLNFFQSSVAFVTDNSFFGYTSPVLGARSRFEITPMVGSLSFYSLLADYRRYAMTGEVSFAFRGMHYGRHGKDASGIDTDGVRVFWPLFVGDPYLIRGYASGSFSASECEPANGTLDCPVFDRLTGSRIAVANLEVRVPLIGTERYGLLAVPFVPTEIAAFVDAGLAWSRGDDVKLAFLRDTPQRVPVFSTGLSARFNLFGYIVLETYWAYPFQRPDKGGHFGLQINPGW
jgi:WD40 repeat protein